MAVPLITEPLIDGSLCSAGQQRISLEPARTNRYLLFRVTLIEHAHSYTSCAELINSETKLLVCYGLSCLLRVALHILPSYLSWAMLTLHFPISPPPPPPPPLRIPVFRVSIDIFSISPERGDRKSGNHSHVFSESVKSAELFQFKTLEKFSPLSITRLCLPHVV